MNRSSLLVGVAAAVFPACMPLCAQMHVVKKPETVVRAVGVYEWTGEEAKPKASRLVPVTLFIDGKLEDAGVYLARPVPMALQTGTLFELDQAGKPDGLLEISFARQILAPDGQFDDGWMGFGSYRAAPRPVLTATRKSGPLSKIVQSGGKPDSGGPKFGNKSTRPSDSDDSDRPVLKRKTDADATATSSTPDDPDRPTLTRKTAQADSAPETTTPDDPNSEVERPTLRKRTPAQRDAARKQHDSASVSGVGSLNDDPDRPTLHRGKAPGSMDEGDLPALAGLPPDMHQRVAVSDAVNRPAHDFSRAWASEAEHTAILTQLQAIARTRLAAYGSTPAPASKPTLASKTSPAASTPAARRRQALAAKAAAAKDGRTSLPLPLNKEQLQAYTLSYGGDATYVYSASTPGPDGADKLITLVAQKEDPGELRIALSTVTDANHLDRTPQLRLVDVVDAEASNRASLLMELRAQHSRQFALYRVIGAQAQQTFLSGTTE